MRILGIHDGHTSTASYLEDGTIRSTVSEERFSRIKGDGGFPAASIKYVLNTEGIQPFDLDMIALVGFLKPLISIDQYRTGRQRVFPHLVRLFPGDPRWLIRQSVKIGKSVRLKDQELLKQISEAGLELGKIELIEHHQAHAATAYYLSPFSLNKEEALVITLDGSGDGLSGSVSVVDSKGEWTRLHELSTFDSLGMVYSRITQLLGMKPWEHEYKLMGMAPYVAKEHAVKASQVMGKYLDFSSDKSTFKNKTRLWGNSLLERMAKDLRGFRFDNIAAGAQLFHEERVTAFVKKWIQQTGVKRVAVAGGCFMNVKANKLLMELEECKDLFVMPSCGDESCAMGAAIWAYVQVNSPDKRPVERLQNLYLGPKYTDPEIEKALEQYRDSIEIRECGNIEAECARLLSEHKIIGRLAGRMEWGARALGNRSILANPVRPQNLRKLNAAIKMRDFWMPFAPSILWERKNDYAVLKKQVFSYYMTMAYDSSELAEDHLIAALHPYDFTMRPQFIKKEQNPSYHMLLSEFEKITGFGGVLNTSFNLHGYPIVCSPEDALRTFMNSDLDYVAIEKFLVRKKV